MSDAAVLGARGLRKTLRLQGYTSDPSVDPWKNDRGAIYCMWHENMLPATFLAPTHGLRVLVSQSRDGDLITRFIQGFQMEAIRGSSTRGAVRAIREMVRTSSNHSITITPDGPVGPRREFQAGAVYLASRTGLPLVSLGFALSATWRLPSWDRMAIPKPFSQIVLLVGEAMHVPDDLDSVGLEEYTRRITADMDATEAKAAAIMAGQVAPPMHGETHPANRTMKEVPLRKSA